MRSKCECIVKGNRAKGHQIVFFVIENILSETQWNPDLLHQNVLSMTFDIRHVRMTQISESNTGKLFFLPTYSLIFVLKIM